MKLGDILGSISPAYGAITGHGLGGVARNLNLPFLLYQLLHHDGQHQQDMPQQPMMQGQTLGDFLQRVRGPQFPMNGQPGPYPGYNQP